MLFALCESMIIDHKLIISHDTLVLLIRNELIPMDIIVLRPVAGKLLFIHATATLMYEYQFNRNFQCNYFVLI